MRAVHVFRYGDLIRFRPHKSGAPCPFARPWLGLLLWVLWLSVPQSVSAQPEEFQGAVAVAKWQALYPVGKVTQNPSPLPQASPLVNLSELKLVGPQPGHPFVLGHFAADADWGVIDGWLRYGNGKNAALQLAWADQFVLEGVMEQGELGGWFFLVGWDEGQGYALSNVTLKQSGSPWFLSRFRGAKAIEGASLELEPFEWKGEQPFKLTVSDNELTLQVGEFQVAQQPLEGYRPGRVVLGTYDTRYGSKPLRVKTLRIQALPAAKPAADAPAEGAAEDAPAESFQFQTNGFSTPERN